MNEDLKPKDVYRFEGNYKAPDTSNYTFVGDEVPENKTARVCRMCVVDLTTKAKVVRFGYKRGSTNYWFYRRTIGTNNYDQSIATSVILSNGERPIAMVEAPTTGDILQFYVFGSYKFMP